MHNLPFYCYTVVYKYDRSLVELVERHYNSMYS